MVNPKRIPPEAKRALEEAEERRKSIKDTPAPKKSSAEGMAQNQLDLETGNGKVLL